MIFITQDAEDVFKGIMFPIVNILKAEEKRKAKDF